MGKGVRKIVIITRRRAEMGLFDAIVGFVVDG